MANKKPAEAWQPLLLDLKAPAPEEKPEPRIEYERGVVRRRPRAETNSEAPWWNRVRQVEDDATARPAPALSWGGLWLKLISSLGWLEGVRAGQRMVMETAVRGLDVRAGVIEASAGGGKTKPHRVQLRFTPLTPAEWARLGRQIIDDGADAAACAELEAGRIPMALVDAADRHGVPLLPRRVNQLITACTCGGARLPCDHVLGVHLAIARKLDGDPLQVLAFRGGQPAMLSDLFARVRAELQGLAQAPTRTSGDPLLPGEGPPPDWSVLDLPAAQRSPLPLPEGWRARETLDAVVRRIIGAAQMRL